MMKIKMFFSIIGRSELKGTQVFTTKKDFVKSIGSVWDSYKEGEEKQVLLVFKRED